MADRVDVKSLIVVPAVITLFVTLLRLTGELLNWSPALFNPAAGGGGALVGIAWLVPIFGFYFGWKLASAGERPAGLGPSIGYPLLGGVLLPAAGFAATILGVPQNSLSLFAVFVVFSIIGAIVAFRGWPVLGRILVLYGLAARIPVIVVMFLAILGSWGTHYDVPPPGFPEMGPIARWVAIGVVPQLTIWIWYTVVLGGVFGGLAAALAGRTRRPATA